MRLPGDVGGVGAQLELLELALLPITLALRAYLECRRGCAARTSYTGYCPIALSMRLDAEGVGAQLEILALALCPITLALRAPGDVEGGRCAV